MNSKKIIKNKNFYQFQKVPTKEKLTLYYKNKYFIKNKSYNYKYPAYELKYHINNSKLKVMFLKKNIKLGKKKIKLIDLGAGQGIFTNTIAAMGNKFNITAVDFSKKNFLFKNNKKIKFIESDPQAYLDHIDEYDLVFLNNVIEHVINPIKVLKLIRSKLKKNSILCITVPNDFSVIQNYLLKNEFIKNKHWISYPEHLNYFSNLNFEKVLKKLKLKILDSYSEFPIEFFLFGEKTNYIKYPKFGMSAHKMRCDFLNFLFETSKPNKIINLHKSFYQNNIGRDSVYLLKK